MTFCYVGQEQIFTVDVKGIFGSEINSIEDYQRVVGN